MTAEGSIDDIWERYMESVRQPHDPRAGGDDDIQTMHIETDIPAFGDSEIADAAMPRI